MSEIDESRPMIESIGVISNAESNTNAIMLKKHLLKNGWIQM